MNASIDKALQKWNKTFPIDLWDQIGNATTFGMYDKIVPNRTWIEARARSVLSPCRGMSEWAHKEVAALIEQQVRELLIIRDADDLLCTRPTTNPRYWEVAESRARTLLNGKTVKTKQVHLPWSGKTYHRLFLKTLDGDKELFNKLLLHNIYRSHRPETTWIRATNTLGCHAIITMEAAMTAFLRRAGFGLNPRLGEFWKDMAWDQLDENSSVDCIPNWRWQLLREAYLAAFVWALAQTLFGLISPFSNNCQTEIRIALGSISTMFGWVWGLRRSMCWFGAEMPRDSKFELTARHVIGEIVGPETAFDYLNPKTHILDFERIRFMGQTYQVPPQFQHIRSAAMPYMLYDRPACFSRRADGSWTGDIIVRRVRDEVIGNHFLLGLDTASETCAFHLVMNLLLASQSRYATMLLGPAFKAWLIREHLPCDPLGIFGQFGQLPSADWLGCPSLSHLFCDLELGASGQALLRRKPLQTQCSKHFGSLMCKEVGTMWSAVEKAPLSFPVMPVNSGGDGLGTVKILERCLRSYAHNLCPFTLEALNNPSQVRELNPADRQEFLTFRERIYAPIFSKGKVPHGHKPLESGEFADGTQGTLNEFVDRLYRAWVAPWAPRRS